MAPRTYRGGADAAFSNCLLNMRFIINTAPGPPLPSLLQLIFFPESGQMPAFVAFESDGSGELRADFGVPDGTPGRAQITQRGVLMSKGKRGPCGDFFPAEPIG